MHDIQRLHPQLNINLMRIQKCGTLHDFACHPCAGGHANLLCIVPILVYVLPKQVQYEY